MRKYSIIILSSIFFLLIGSSCEEYDEILTQEMREAEREILENNEDGLPAYCSEPYDGPDINIQIDSHCMTVYNYICNGGYDPNSDEIQSICDTYDAMREGTSYPACPYCE
ncbi:MAG: hypothetical protein ACOCUV_01375 [bacterium]